MISILLQMRYTGFGRESDPVTLIITIVVIVALGFLLYIVSRVRGNTGGTTASGAPQWSKRTFKKRAQSIGLPDRHISALLNLIKTYSVRNPYRLLNNNPQLDKLIRDGLDDIETRNDSEEKKEADKLVLFQTKQIIERNSQKRSSLRSTRQLKINQPLILSTSSASRYQSRVIANMKDSLQVEPPVVNRDRIIQWKRWTPLNVFMQKDNNSTFSFTTKVMGYKSTRGNNVLLLQHSDDIKQSQKRRFRRKQLDKPAYFTRVNIIQEGRGRKSKKRAVIDEQSRALGTILDISSGGCSIRSRKTLREGSLTRIEFETDVKERIVAFGKIIKVTRNRSLGSIMHVMFTRVSRQNLNKINYFIYAQDQEE